MQLSQNPRTEMMIRGPAALLAEGLADAGESLQILTCQVLLVCSLVKIGRERPDRSYKRQAPNRIQTSPTLTASNIG